MKIKNIIRTILLPGLFIVTVGAALFIESQIALAIAFLMLIVAGFVSDTDKEESHSES